jgi:hypothetical protein
MAKDIEFHSPSPNSFGGNNISVNNQQSFVNSNFANQQSSGNNGFFPQQNFYQSGFN